MGFLDLFKASENKQLSEQVALLQQKNEALIQQFNQLEQKYHALEASVPKEQSDFDRLKQQSQSLQADIERMTAEQESLQNSIADLQEKRAEYNKCVSDAQKLRQLHQQYKAAIKGYEKNPENWLAEVEVEDILLPVVTIDLNCMNMRDLRSKYRQNQREIQRVFKRYEGRYTTKANIAIYQLMVIAMEAELQNVLSTLSFGKVDDAVNHMKAITQRYYEVAVEGNQSIAPTMKSFIAEIEFLFIETIKVEYEYHVKKEQAKEEQRALREQMRQEAEERKALEAERKKVEREESKFSTEIERLAEKISDTTDQDAIEQLQARIAELQEQMQEVQKRKADIVNLQHGKAGHVYIISNLGSFGDDVFKIGMTRRLEPMDRVKELGNASVPFEFDVHSFIYSQDAVGLENSLHKKFNQQRVNKVNLRKEFFRVPIDQLEQAVMEYDPTAEFRRTMVAEQYYQSINRTDVVPELEEDTADIDDE